MLHRYWQHILVVSKISECLLSDGILKPMKYGTFNQLVQPQRGANDVPKAARLVFPGHNETVTNTFQAVVS